MRVYARGNNGTREGFCLKTSPVTPSNVIIESKRQKKTKKILQKEICTLCKLSFFQVYKKSAP